VTNPTHPSLDELADYAEDLLDAERTREVAAHVSTCTSCSDALADLDAVSTMLSSVGSERRPMPAEGASSLDSALARARIEETAGVPSLTERRLATAPSRRRGLATKLLLAGAVVAVVGLVGFELSSSPSGDDDTAASGGGSSDSGLERELGPGAGVAGDSPPKAPVPSGAMKSLAEPQGRLAADQVADLARQLTRVPPAADYPVSRRCAATVTSKVTAGSSATEVAWQGRPAVLVADQKRREARVYTCSHSDLVFTTRF